MVLRFLCEQFLYIVTMKKHLFYINAQYINNVDLIKMW